MNDPVIAVENAHKTFSHLRVLNGLSFSLPAGTCLGLLGPNGAGKTTMMKLLYGSCLRDPTPPSRIRVFGCDPQHDALRVKYLSGVVTQESQFDEQLSLRMNLKVHATYYGIPSKDADPRIAELLDFMELDGKQEEQVKRLSGGMRRRLVIARALLSRPRLLFLDEPTTGLDPQVRHLIWEKIRWLKKNGITVLLSTHYMEEAFQLCDNLLIMDKGSLVLEGPPRTLLERYVEKYVLEISDPSGLDRVIEPSVHRAIRKEESQNSVRVYADDRELLDQIIRAGELEHYYFRESTLEDLFMRVTGRVLNDQQ